MLCVEVILKKSELHGLGIFAAEFIPNGSLIWKFDSSVDKKINKYSIDKSQLKYYEHFAWIENGYYVLCGDYAKYTNHSSRNNVSLDKETGNTIANRDIEIGEEITENYEEMYGSKPK